MSDICTVRKSTLDGIAEAIQSKTGESGGMLPSEMAGKIEDIPSSPTKGLVFSDYDADGYPHKAELVGFTDVPAWYGWRLFDSNNIGKYMEELTIAEGTITLGNGAFNNNDALKSVILPASLTRAAFACCSNMESVICLGTLSTCQNVFSDCTAVTLYDFSHHTAVPHLGTAISFGHASGCVIKIPSALYTAWTTHSIWGALTDVVWEAV